MVILEKVIGLGAFVMMPIVIFLMGVIFRVKPKDALRAGITVGVGFKGISLASSLITTTMTPLVTKLQELWGLGLDAVDLGVPVVSSMAFSDGKFVLMMFGSVLFMNAIMLVLKITKTLNVDIWNFWHYLFIGTLGTIVSGNMFVGLAIGVLYSVINLILADRNQEIICEVSGEQYRGLSFCTMAFPFLVPFNQLIDRLIDAIPGVKKINFNLKKIPEKYAFFTEPIMIGLICGIGLGLLAQYSWDQCLEVGMTMAAAMFLLPRMISILMEGLSPIASGTRDFMAERFKGREFRIGMDFALLVGDADMITLGMVFVPLSLLLAVIIPGNRVLPLIGLTNLSYMMMAPVIASRRNMFRALIIGAINITIVFFIATSLTPLITEMSIQKGVAEPGGYYSIFNTGEHVGFILLKLVEFLKGLF
ncbi:PTS transporter subunit IIC [Enterococcus avium]|uniref:PTS transporter subunit IIC n=1 Tax=Enterococcus avium TaxID=33945 RepID=UPI002891A996|nr:PTS transporter subunit IIC [Enterococcus avium]MDT2395809.1 PTS transporter subunit IIC [Enterococcus avium]MDT2420226.1 PTS transporter subunit IIC [Enterococcus avium]MDT2432328.1 PTS transporter subunit IIC [Enterococcus avium]MDT2442098.1 PTS transporter subunit IIC [Enterococcus avium]MDT2455020.1 PTS transporter subunit IIC [Enterococcus avium]